MSVQVSTCINEITKPFNAATPLGDVLNLQVRQSAFLFRRGCMKCKMWMADNFYASLEDFNNYME